MSQKLFCSLIVILFLGCYNNHKEELPQSKEEQILERIAVHYTKEIKDAYTKKIKSDIVQIH